MSHSCCLNPNYRNQSPHSQVKEHLSTDPNYILQNNICIIHYVYYLCSSYIHVYIDYIILYWDWLFLWWFICNYIMHLKCIYNMNINYTKCINQNIISLLQQAIKYIEMAIDHIIYKWQNILPCSNLKPSVWRNIILYILITQSGSCHRVICHWP